MPAACQCVICVHVTSFGICHTSRERNARRSLLSSSRRIYRKWTWRLMGIAACGGETDRETDTDRIKADGRKQASSSTVNTTHCPTAAHFHLDSWRETRTKEPQTNPILHVQFNKAVPCGYLDTSGTGYMTHRTEKWALAKTQYDTVQHNTALHTQLARQICTSTDHSHRSTSTVQHKHTTAGLIKY
jgi:hypothetical protein